MIYFTQLIYLKEGKEETFLEFEDHVLPLLNRHGGKLVQRWRNTQGVVIHSEGAPPFELHLVSFESEAGFQAYVNDPERTKAAHLKDGSVEKSVLIKGQVIA